MGLPDSLKIVPGTAIIWGEAGAAGLYLALWIVVIVLMLGGR